MTSTAAPLGGTVRFGLDGTEYEIDLNAGQAQQPEPRVPGSAPATMAVTSQEPCGWP
jgi:hypothetical protein